MRLSGIFKALDGGHLDGAVFGSDRAAAKKRAADRETVKSRIPRLSRGWRGAVRSATRDAQGQDISDPDPDT